MTKKEWMARLRSYIQGLPSEEQKRIFDYYEELYADKRDTGMSEWDIIAEFGNPQEVAGKMLTEMSTLHQTEQAPVCPPKTEQVRTPDPVAPDYQNTAAGYNPSAQSYQNQNNYNPTAQGYPNRAPTGQNAPNYGYPAPGYQPLSPIAPEKRKFSFGRLIVFLLLILPCTIVLVSLIIAGWAVFLALTISGVAIAVGGGASAIYTIVTAGGAMWLAYAGIGLAMVGGGIALTAICSKLMGVFIKATGKFFRSLKKFLYRRVKA